MSEHRPSTGDTIDLRLMFRKLLGNWWLFGICIVLAAGVAYAYLKTTPKRYSIEASILMGEKSANPFSAGQDEFLKGMSLLRTSSEMDDEIAQLMSRSMVKKTLKRLDYEVSYHQRERFLTTEIYDYPNFFVHLDSASLQILDVPIHVEVDRGAGTYRVRASGRNVRLYNPQTQRQVEEFMEEIEIDRTVGIGERFTAENLSFSIDFPEDRTYKKERDDYFVIHSLDGLVSLWRATVAAEPLSKESNIVILRSEGQVVSKHVKFMNKLMETYLEAERYKRDQKGYKTIDFIDTQLGSVKDTLSQAEQAMKEAQTTGGVMGNAVARSEALFEDRSRQLDEQARVQAKIQYFSYILEYMKSAGDMATPMAPSASNIDAPVLNNLIIEYINDVNQRGQLNLTTKQSTPVLVALDRKIQTNKQAILQTAEGLLEQARLDLSQINSRLGGINAMFSQLPENTRRLGVAQRRFDLSSELYNYLMEKRAEAGIAIASDQLDKTVVDEARMNGDGPIAPSVKMLGIMALLAGLLIPLLFILVRDFFNDKIADVEEVKRLCGVPILCTIPSSKRKRVVPDEQRSMLAEAFRTARINLQYFDPGSSKQVIGFTSSTSGEGKTFCAVNLATIMAMSGKRTLLIDSDMRRPRVAESLDLPEGDGLSTFLIGGCTMDRIVRSTDVPGLDVITAGPIPPNPLELLETPKLPELLAAVKERYDHIIIDSAPMGLVSEYVIVVRHVDVTLFVARRGYTRRGHLRRLNELHVDGKVEHIDLLVNDVKPGSGYGEGYGYYVK